jgi:hypothetical protein
MSAAIGISIVGIGTGLLLKKLLPQIYADTTLGLLLMLGSLLIIFLSSRLHALPLKVISPLRIVAAPKHVRRHRGHVHNIPFSRILVGCSCLDTGLCRDNSNSATAWDVDIEADHRQEIMRDITVLA